MYYFFCIVQCIKFFVRERTKIVFNLPLEQTEAINKKNGKPKINFILFWKTAKNKKKQGFRKYQIIYLRNLFIFYTLILILNCCTIKLIEMIRVSIKYLINDNYQIFLFDEYIRKKWLVYIWISGIICKEKDIEAFLKFFKVV